MGCRFHITGYCNPQRHYMVRLDGRLKRIREDYVDCGSYFVINRGKQYGKTTTLNALKKYLEDDYIVLALVFQELETANYANGVIFSQAFAKKLSMAFRYIDIENKEKLRELLLDFKKDNLGGGLDELFECLSRGCEECPCPVILMIDEVDSAGNNQVFIDFLAQLRGYYLKRDKIPIFHSVILAGVYDIKNLKLKLRPESEHQYNSPWNIAAKFKIDMDFSAKQIAGMLEECEADCRTGMDIQAVAEEIYGYTSGYPVLISSICKYIDEDFPDEEGLGGTGSAWSKADVPKAVKKILVDKIPLFESMVRHLDVYPAMKRMFQAILFQGSEFVYNPYTKEINLACMFGYAVDREGKVQIANRIFETQLYNYFLSEEEISSAIGNMAKRDKSYK